MFRARHTDEGVLLACDEEELEELLGYLAAEANHQTDRRQQKRLDQAFEVLNGFLVPS